MRYSDNKVILMSKYKIFIFKCDMDRLQQNMTSISALFHWCDFLFINMKRGSPVIKTENPLEQCCKNNVALCHWSFLITGNTTGNKRNQ